MPRDPDTGWSEADVAIDGVPLSFAQVMAMRVAVSSFRLQLTDPAFRAGVGERLAAGYDRHLAIVEQRLVAHR
jgi:hypothetical protein